MSAPRNLILVVGVGRSGTSLFAGIMSQLGLHVPQPEVEADDTNPKGFGEPKWVVDFHTRLMRSKKVHVYDARPVAWERTAAAAAEPEAREELRTWLAGEVGDADVIVKDPRIAWFLPLWNDTAAAVGLEPVFVTMLRHPSQVLTSAKKSYGTWQTDASRAASWINVMLETERATRGTRRAFVAYPDLLNDWAGTLRTAGATLGIEQLATVDAAAHPAIDEFVDPSLFRNRTGWEGLEVPQRVIDLIEEVWAELQDVEAAGPAFFDTARERYDALYGEAEAISHSSVIAMRPRKKPAAKGGKQQPASLMLKVKRRLRRALKG